MNERWANMVPGDQHPLRHGLAFLICGLISLSVDALVLKLLTVLFGLHPFVARIAAIMVAMTSGWLSHRTFTFALKTPPTVAEFLRYMAVGWFVSAVNYGVFVIILLLSLSRSRSPRCSAPPWWPCSLLISACALRPSGSTPNLSRTRAESPQIDARRRKM